MPKLTPTEWAVQEFAPKGHPPFTAFVFDPAQSFRGSAILLRQDLAMHVRDIRPLVTGASLNLKFHGISVTFTGMHLPHLKRSDALDVWQEQFAELQYFHSRLRHHDVSILAGDWNYNLHAACDGSEFSILARSFLQEHGYLRSQPVAHTWENHNSSNAIDFVCVRCPDLSPVRDSVRWDCPAILHSDHALIDFSFITKLVRAPARRRVFTLCGKWITDSDKLQVVASQMAENLDLNKGDLTVSALSSLAARVCRRPSSLRYQDPPEVKELIRERRLAPREQGKVLGHQIVELRRAKRQDWLANVLSRARGGDFAAVTYFRRRQSTSHTHVSYAIRAGGVLQAARDLRQFYAQKFASPNPPGLALAMVESHAASSDSFRPFLMDELDQALAEAKRGKSAGETGITYELLQAVAQSELREHLLDMFNGVFDGSMPVPQQWLVHRVTFLPKIPRPLAPKDLRPIVLSDCCGKLFSKLLLYRLRDLFLPNTAGQLCGSAGCQALEGAAALQQLTYQANAFHKPLIAVKLDIQSAFDTLDHQAVAVFLCSLPPCRETEMLMFLIVHAKVLLGICGQEWSQQLERGILQGSSYSAEIFAKVLDWWLAQLLPDWNAAFPAHWCRSASQLLHCIIYADDLVLLASSWDEAELKFHGLLRHLKAIGLSISFRKCSVIASAACGEGSLRLPDGNYLHAVDSFVFLGVLQGFEVTSQQVIARRLTGALNSFWGFYAIMRASCTPVAKRIHLFNAFITSKWQWMAGCVRPVTAVLRALNTCMLTMLVQMTGLQYDVFMSPVGNWLSRRRGSKMILQSLGVSNWGGVLAQMYWSFWGHVARVADDSRAIKICIACSFSLDLQNRRVLGNWPDHHRFLQLAWQQVRLPGQPAAWFSGAKDRNVWQRASSVWRSALALRSPNSYQDLEQVDLCGRCLVRTGDYFALLPKRHPPAEPPFTTSFQAIPSLGQSPSVEHWRVYCSGVCQNSHSGIAVVVASPHSPPSKWLVRRRQLPELRTEAQTEVAAVIEAVGMARALNRTNTAPLLWMLIDSLGAIQGLLGSARGGLDPVTHAQLQSAWHAIEFAATLVHVKYASKDPVYRQCVIHAKHACQNEHGLLETFFLDGTHGYIGADPPLSVLPLSAHTRSD